jgi:DnaK suppressor protein
MNANGKSQYRLRLELLRSRIGADAIALTRETLGPSGGQDSGDLSNAPFHLADEGTEEFLHDMSAALAENEEYLVKEIDAALGRLTNDTFGACESCGSAIASERLDAMPYVRYCVQCAQKQQSGLPVNLNSGRPQTPADTYSPEGAMQEGWSAGRGDAASSGRGRVNNDEHAVGEPGGGSSIGGLAGTTIGRGDPTVADLQDAAGSGEFDAEEARDIHRDVPKSGRAGGAVGGTPAHKRTK